MPTKKKLVVIAKTKDAGRAKYGDDAVIVTPKSPDAAQGITGARVIVMRDMEGDDHLDELLAAVAPVSATVDIRFRNPRQTETFHPLSAPAVDEGETGGEVPTPGGSE